MSRQEAARIFKVTRRKSGSAMIELALSAGVMLANAAMYEERKALYSEIEKWNPANPQKMPASKKV